MGMVTFSEAPQSILRMVEELVQEFHPDLIEANIAVVYRSEPQVSNGRTIYGQAAKIAPKIQPLLHEVVDFIIWVDEKFCEKAKSEHVRALLDHELQHCRMVDGTPSLRPHDFEEFTAIVERHGFWNPALVDLKNAITGNKYRQTPLIDESLVTISGHGKIVTMTSAEFSRAAEAIAPDLPDDEDNDGQD